MVRSKSVTANVLLIRLEKSLERVRKYFFHIKYVQINGINFVPVRNIVLNSSI